MTALSTTHSLTHTHTHVYIFLLCYCRHKKQQRNRKKHYERFKNKSIYETLNPFVSLYSFSLTRSLSRSLFRWCHRSIREHSTLLINLSPHPPPLDLWLTPSVFLFLNFAMSVKHEILCTQHTNTRINKGKIWFSLLSLESKLGKLLCFNFFLNNIFIDKFWKHINHTKQYPKLHRTHLHTFRRRRNTRN